ncbi:MAG: N-acetylmuramoyl-L-alanine amidase [Kiritimatiellae bacterium]|nr:N-acetylmuramoyl-L-alanine amidase [Kiritimatiellia bacterium]
MSLASSFLALVISFPAPNAALPYIEKSYMIGAVDRGIEKITVQGKEVEVYRTGAWATMVDVGEGTNTVSITVGDFTTNHTFKVAAKPAPPDPNAPKAKPKEWKKLDYCGDEPKEKPKGKAPGEITVIIDPGHGGGDTGAISPHGLFEKNANLTLASIVRDEFSSRGWRVLMTREEDVALVLTERPRLAHKENADAFISIHHNAPAANQDASKARYTSVYSWNKIGEELSKAISEKMAQSLKDELVSKGSLHANFAVTRNPEIPSCLVEADFITSPEGEEAIFSRARQKKIAEAIADGFAAWLEAE